MWRPGSLGEENKPNQKVEFFKNCHFLFQSDENNIAKLVE